MQKKYAILGLLFASLYLEPTTLSEYATVFSMYLKNPSEMGEVAPFSEVVGNELVKYIVKSTKNNALSSKIYLEAGGGCGAVSVCIAKKMRECDHLDIVEINPELCKLLRKRLKSYKNVSVHCCSILDWKPDYKYDAVVCTLPFLSLGIDFTKQAMNYFKDISAAHSIFSYVDYPLIKMFRTLAYSLRLQPYQVVAVQKYMDGLKERHLLEYQTVYRNLPSTNVYHMCFEAT